MSIENIKKPSKNIIELYSLLVFMVFIVLSNGCAGPNKGGAYSSRLSGNEMTYAKENNNSSENILVVIRFPAFFSENALGEFSFSYDHYPLRLSGKKHATPSKKNQPSAYANEAINKTAYFALEFYHGLARRLPPQSVMLQPLEVVLDATGRIESKPVNAYPPSVLIVDFFIYRAPQRDITKEAPLTFGDLVSPLIAIKTAPEASPATFGAISYVEPLAPPGQNVEPVERAERMAGHAFIEYLSDPNGAEETDITTTMKQPRDGNKVLKFPLVNLKMNGSALEAHAKASNDGIEKSQFLVAIDAHFNAIIDALNTLDHSRATHNGNRHYIELYDSELASRTNTASLSREDQFKLQLINKFKKLEHTFLAKQSEANFRQLCLGDYGKSVRQLMASEAKYIAKVRRNASDAGESKFWKNTAFAMSLAANFMAGLSGQPLDNSHNIKAQQLMQTHDSMIASYEKENRELSKAFQESFANTYLKQTEYRTVALEGERVIHAKNLSELREKLSAYYKQKTQGLQQPHRTAASGMANQAD